MGRRQKDQFPRNVMVLIDRIAAEVAADESALRARIVGLLNEQRVADAKKLLKAWDQMAAGEVLKYDTDRADGRKG